MKAFNVLIGAAMAVGAVLSVRAAAGYEVVCAASDTPEALKGCAKYVCPADDARETLQKALDEAGRLGVKCVLLKGTYVIDSRGKTSPKGAVFFRSGDGEEHLFYAQNKSHFITLEGAIEPLGFRDGAVIEMGPKLYASIRDDETFSMFACDGGDIYSRAWAIRKLVVRLPGNAKPVVVFDGRFATALKYEDVWAIAFDPMTADFATAANIPVPNARCVAFRGTMGSNYVAMSNWRNLAAYGFGIGFEIGGEHVSCDSLSALYNVYGFSFSSYSGKRSIALGESAPPVGGTFYPIVCVNLLDEHNVNMPRFGCAPHGSWTGPHGGQSVTIRGMNLQWPNTCPGHTDRAAADFTSGRTRATEAIPGAWRGSVEYVIDHTTVQGGVNLVTEPFFEPGHGKNVTVRNLSASKGR